MENQDNLIFSSFAVGSLDSSGSLLSLCLDDMINISFLWMVAMNGSSWQNLTTYNTINRSDSVNHSVWIYIIMSKTYYTYTYKRILYNHQRNMSTLEELHPELYVAFKVGHFVGQKSMRRIRKIALDHMNEQLIDNLKNNGSLGLDLLTGDPATFRHQLVIDNKVTQMLSLFESEVTRNDKHHEQYTKFQENMKVLS